ncbi:hypothetical protein [Paenibacillus tyrfis]|uniref:hypothetical protein n=1 Tax=Paenibacillus tyrfis TaxID=1501230 RepID=UPI0020A109C0|nr:hypothetical protein [Paenibacillus tyrfis]MCP1312116.1 hypothetical protein [Paenibacillus tyrfis]
MAQQSGDKWSGRLGRTRGARNSGLTAGREHMPQRRSGPLVLPKGYGIVLKAAREPKMGRVPGAAGNVPSSPALAFKGAYRLLVGLFLPGLEPVACFAS